VRVRDGAGTPARRELLPRPAADAVLAAVLVAGSFVPGLAHQGVDLAELPDRPLDGPGVLLVVAQALPLVWRRRFPGPCLAVVGAGFAAHQLLAYPTAFAGIGLLVALYSAGAHLDRGRAATAATVLVAYAALATGLHARGSPETLLDYLTFALVLVVCAAAGAGVRARAAHEAEARRRAEQDVLVAERARIARDLHDVITHHVTAMVVQADAAAFLVEQGADGVPGSLARIGEAGREALTDLRSLLGALQPPATGGATPGGAGREPTWGDLAGLVERARAAGQPVELRESGERPPTADAARVAAYRVVQEALTNALKHAAGRPTTVHLRHAEDGTDVEIRTDGGAAAPAGRSGGGHGLVGLRERVRLAGGTWHAGPGPDGGFTVRARIPRGEA
jgi:signal transduction histidine kinase